MLVALVIGKGSRYAVICPCSPRNVLITLGVSVRTVCPSETSFGRKLGMIVCCLQGAIKDLFGKY